MPQWFLPYTAAALVAAAIGWLALSYDPDAGSPTAKPALAGAPAQPAQQTSSQGGAAPTGGAPAPAAAPAAHAGGSGEAAVRSVVTEAMTSNRAADCTRLYTQGFLEQLSGEIGAAAVAECRENADGDADAESVQFRRIEPKAGSYEVAITLVGGEMAGSDLGFVVAHRGAWKIDRMLAVDIDMDQLASAAADQAIEEGAEESSAQCLAEHVAAADEAAYERAMLEGRSKEFANALGRSAIDCVSAASLRRQIAEGIRAGAGPEVPEALIECVIDHIVAGKSAAQLRAMLKMDDSAGMQLGREAGALCAQSMGVSS